MIHVNENFAKLKAGYLFPEIGRRVNVFAQANPDANIIKLGNLKAPSDFSKKMPATLVSLVNI